MKINNEDIISAAKTLRNQQENALTIPRNPLKAKRGRTPWIAAAACAAGFLFGFSVHPSASTSTDSDTQRAQIDTLRREVMVAKSAEPKVIREVVHDTIFTTKVVTREIIREVPVMAKIEEATENETNNSINNPRHTATVGCSMMCDNISYDLIASKN